MRFGSFTILATALALGSARPVERACDAVAFDGGIYLTRYFDASTSNIKASPGQTITATVVDLATCTPYDTGDQEITLMSVSASVVDALGTYEPGTIASVQVNGTNTVSFVAAVPNGSQDLQLSVSARFTPGSWPNLQYAWASLGVVYTAA
ncbi:hypothetical protein BKA62DRAFT_703384 [Auriculariales sp. MPI-PUGE-AT-0066]|nr:hypothetical protein BKA62DRAFT_703384 [Auriculariales sp. MPI-PUGE-AT-0066]